MTVSSRGTSASMENAVVDTVLYQRRKMSLSPVANRSFLHGDRKISPSSEKIVYATLDSLALKRTRLPLRLPPADESIAGSTDQERNENGTAGTGVRGEPAKFKVNASPGAKHYAKWLLVSNDSEEKSDSAIEQRRSLEDNAPLQPSLDNFDSLSKIEAEEARNIDRNICNTAARVGRADIDADGDGDGDGNSEVHADRNGFIECAAALRGFPEKADCEKREDRLPDEQSDGSEEEPVIYSKVLVGSNGSCRLIRSIDEQSFIEEFVRLNEEYAFPKKKKKQQFAKSVLHFVPGQLRRPKKTKKKKKCLSLSLNELKLERGEPEIRIDSLRSRTLSREELKYLTISCPTNFVHVASATNPSLISNENTVRSSSEQPVITHEEKCATLPLLVGREDRGKLENENEKNEKVRLLSPNAPTLPVERAIRHSTRFSGAPNTRDEGGQTASGESAKVLAHIQPVKISPRDDRSNEPEEKLELRANFSFLWSRHQSRNPAENRNEEIGARKDKDVENYDDVGPPILSTEDSDYDDVGTPAETKHDTSEPLPKDSEDIYDDVLATTAHPANDSSFDRVEIRKREISGPVCQDEDYYLSINNEYSSVEEDTEDDEEGVYDDVGLPIGFAEERVNSLYSGSATGSMLGLTSNNGKESEWEDLEDPAATLPCASRRTSPSKCQETQASQGKKKCGHRWSRQVRRRRSKGSRNGSKLLRNASHRSTIYVAVSLGRSDGSILLLGPPGNAEEWRWRWRERAEPIYANTTDADDPRSGNTQGLVQMRVIDLDEDMDTQETSCYVYEDNASDDSTYESLHSFQPDDFSTDSEPETKDKSVEKTENLGKNETNAYRLEAPTRPTPPPPREASLTETLGRRIKMLRRTWSITKGSLGRIRRRTSVEEGHCYDENRQPCTDNHHGDTGKYFSFSRHFRKNVTGFSTFYLENTAPEDGGKNDRRFHGDTIYSNLDYARINSGAFTSSVNSPETVEPFLPKETSPDHYSVLTEQEPLYQFYAAAAARVAFHSDSDGYEEVEDLTASHNNQATIELVRSGRRTLWCQTAQVLNTGLLQRLTPEQRKVQEAKFEILTSEASYLNSLRVLETEFLEDLTLNNQILSAAEREKLFGSIPGVTRASEKFLAELEAVWRQDPMLNGLPDILIKYADKCLDIYVSYCSNQVSMDTTLKELRTQKGSKFLEAVARIESRPICQSLSLHSFLMLPMQRITRLPLLADAVLSKISMEHTDRSIWERVLSSFSYVVAECNEGARAAAKEAEMESLAKKLEYSTKIKPISLKGRHLVRSGPVVQLLTKADPEYKLTFGKKFNKSPLYLLLLTDYLLVTKCKPNNNQEDRYMVIDTCQRNLIALESISEESPFAGRNAMLLALLENHCGHQTEYILTCESNTERQRWLEAVSPSERGLVGETLYESWDCPQVVALYSYSPNQPDELVLQPGDVINVLRKMADGWYHGEKLLDGEQGWFPGNYTKEVASEHVRARNLKQRHRLLAFSGSVLQRKAKQQSAIC